VLALIATGFLAFGLWVHHMFATGLPQLGESFFTASSMLIAIPSGCRSSAGSRRCGTGTAGLRTPLLFVLGFFVIFVIGG
jgi:heme/copper-type cytochrome/quinol oxidase subunit 1